MKATKGEAGYIQARKKQLILKAVLEFGIVIALLILGIWQTHTRLNLLTVVAVLGCLPAAKALVEVITISPYHSIAEERAKEIQKHAEDLTAAFDLVFTSKDKFMPVDSIICLLYTSSYKVKGGFRKGDTVSVFWRLPVDTFITHIWIPMRILKRETE